MIMKGVSAVITKVIAHRGSKGTHPENTLAAFKEAIRVKSDGIELDVHFTKDRELVVIHDETLDRTTNGTGNVGEQTLEEIKQYDAGSWFSPTYQSERIPTLAEVLSLLTGYEGLLNIEIKTDKIAYEGIEQALVSLVQQMQPTCNIVYSSFNFKSLKKIKSLNPTAEIACLFKMNNKQVKLFSRTAQVSFWHPSIQWLKTKKWFFMFPKRGHLRVWTVNKEKDMLFCYKKKIAAIITDYPEQALALRKTYQK